MAGGYPVRPDALDAQVGRNNPSYAHDRNITPAIPVVLGTTSATVVGGGSASDTYLLQVTLLKNATAVTVTLGGFQDHAGAAKSVVLTGSTSEDTVLAFGAGLLNTKGALTVTASVADKVIVSYWPAA